MRRILKIRDALDAERDLYVDVLRMFVGALTFGMGVSFATHPGNAMDLFANPTWGPVTRAGLGGLVDIALLAGGAMLAIGLITRAAAAVQLPVVIASVFVEPSMHGAGSIGPYALFAMLLTAVLTMLMFHGGGRWSVDEALNKSFSHHLPGAPQH